eukprot:4082658-Alexandrium_andersonii.AAC.1
MCIRDRYANGAVCFARPIYRRLPRTTCAAHARAKSTSHGPRVALATISRSKDFPARPRPEHHQSELAPIAPKARNARVWT